MLREALLAASRSDRMERLIRSAPVSRSVVDRFVAGDTEADALRAARELSLRGLFGLLTLLGEDVRELGQTEATTKAYIDLLHRLADEGLAGSTELSIKLSAVGQSLHKDADRVCRENTARICATAKQVGSAVSVDMEEHHTVDATLGTVMSLREEFPELGAVVQSYLRRAEADCRNLAYKGSRVRLVKGAYDAPPHVAFQSRQEIDRAYVRCLKILMAGEGYPMIATHDPRLIEIAGALAIRNKRTKSTYEYQMLYGVRPVEQRRLAETGVRVRISVPYGSHWYPYLMRRLAERPANVTFFLRSLVTRS